MKLDTTPQDVAVAGNFKTSAFGMEASAHAFDIIADKIYTYKERAVIREISCNAHDSHVEAGNPQPFDVHLPTHLESWFSVRDYGTGLSDEDIRAIYCTAFKSTKQDSNEVVGCLGLGTKSPFSLADSFTVKSWHGGYCRTYSMYRDEFRKPQVALLTEEPSDEPCGIEVSVNVEDRVSRFEDEAVKVFRYWSYTPNINNKNVIEQIADLRKEHTLKGKDFSLSKSYGSMKAVMGNVAYDIPDELDEFDADGCLMFELGEIHFDAGRENLSLDDKTRAAIKAKFASVKQRLAEVAIQQIESESTPFKRAVLANELSEGQLGRHIKKDLREYELPEPKDVITYWSRGWSRTEKGRADSLPVGRNIEYYEYKDRMTTRIRSYLKDHNKLTMVILTPEQIRECKIDRDVIKDLDGLPKVARSTGKKGSTLKTFLYDRNTYRYGNLKDYWDATTLELDGSEVVYVEISRWEPVKGSSVRSIKDKLEDLETCGINDVQVVGLKSAFTKTKAFRDGNFIELNDFLRRELSRVAPESCFDYDGEQFSKLKSLSEYMTSPELTEWRSMIPSSNKIINICKKYNIEMEKDRFLDEWQREFFKKYEMLSFVSSWEISKNSRKVANYINGEIK